MAVDIGALVTFSRIGSKLVQIGWSANPPQFTDIGHRLAIFTNPCPILIRLDWTIAIRLKKSGVLYIRVCFAVVSMLFRDRPVSGFNVATFWEEWAE